jgi:hypothetical protein
MNTFLRFLVALIVSTTWVVAAYIMDDTNTTIQYLPSNDWVAAIDLQSNSYNGTL